MHHHRTLARDLAIVTALYLVAVLAVGVMRDWAAATWLMVGLLALLAGRLVSHHKVGPKPRR